MGYRVDRVQAVVTFYVEFAGMGQAVVDYAPGWNDPLAEALLVKAAEQAHATALCAAGADELPFSPV